MRLKIISDGVGASTKVVDAETGKKVMNAYAVKWSVSARGVAKAKLYLINVPVEIEGNFTIRAPWWRRLQLWVLGKWDRLR